MPQANLSPQSIKQAIEDVTGYPYELEIARRVETYRKYGYWVEPNYSFEDQDTGEARELDFHATVAEIISLKRSEFAFAVILGSCKASNNPYVFFTRRKPSILSDTLNSDVTVAGGPLEIYGRGDEGEAIESYFQLHNFLHIAKMEIISSQFCELVWKYNKWEVQSEVIFKNIFIPLIKAMSKEIEECNTGYIPDKEEVSTYYTVHYPLLVLRGPMFEYYMPPSGPAQVRDTKHILLVRHYTSRTVQCCYAIDIIHESYLEQYLHLIDGELKKFANLVKRHRKMIVQSIHKLVDLREKTQTEGNEGSE